MIKHEMKHSAGEEWFLGKVSSLIKETHTEKSPLFFSWVFCWVWMLFQEQSICLVFMKKASLSVNWYAKDDREERQKVLMSIVIFWVTVSPILEPNVKYDNNFFLTIYIILIWSFLL